jgi:hypothetical protein
MRCFDPCNRLLNFRESRKTPTPIFGNVSGDLTLSSKWGCDILGFVLFALFFGVLVSTNNRLSLLVSFKVFFNFVFNLIFLDFQKKL